MLVFQNHKMSPLDFGCDFETKPGSTDLNQNRTETGNANLNQNTNETRQRISKPKHAREDNGNHCKQSNKSPKLGNANLSECAFETRQQGLMLKIERSARFSAR